MPQEQGPVLALVACVLPPRTLSVQPAWPAESQAPGLSISPVWYPLGTALPLQVYPILPRQLLAHFHCLSCDRPLETPVTGQ